MTEPDDAAFELDAASNPDLVAAALAMAENQEPPTLEDPLDGPVTLSGGFRRVKMDGEGNVTFEEVTKAWVKELDGEAEERISRARLKGDISSFLDEVLAAGVERLGDVAPTKEDFQAMLMGDRDYLLLEIARATYGDKMEYEAIFCDSCGEEMSADLSIAEDVPVVRLKSFSERNFDVRLRKGVAKVTLPTVEITGEMSKSETPAEANTVLISHCVEEIRWDNGKTTVVRGDKTAAKRLGIVDRQTLITEMAKRMPGPQYNEVKFNHTPGCGKEIRLRIELADLFRGL